MAHHTSVPLCRRWVAGIVAVVVGLGPLATPGYAALTLLADQPLSVQNQAKPNIMLTVDDSTSMLYDFLPDAAIGKYCRDVTGNMNAACGHVDQNTDLTFTGHGKYVTSGYIYEQFGLPFPAYNSAFDASGPGAGCFTGEKCTISKNVCSTVAPIITCGALEGTCAFAPTCSGGIDPGALPGLERYPAGNSPLAGKVYEYWTLWPAPVHNTESNHSYYNPRLNYDPPVFADGTSYPQMNAANTVNWTQVPADPWASPIRKVDLTKQVTVGLWCNSDWTDPRSDPTLVTDPAFCRTNGTGPSASSSSASTPDGDYNYPWAPVGVDPSAGGTTALSIAYSKVDATTHALLPPWATAKDPKYFYENDNTLWCDSTSSLWPHYGPSQTQTCSATSTPQTCQGVTTQTCGGGSPQTCDGTTPQTCTGAQLQVCNNFNPQTCLGAQLQSCGPGTPQTCAGGGAQSCPTAPQTCAGVVTPTCDNITPQTCNNVQTQTCNPVGEVCNLPDPATCPIDWIPPGCNLCTSECGPCELGPVCGPGTCSLTGGACQITSDCPGLKQCSVSHAACNFSTDCPPQAGTCSVVATSCLVSGDCPNLGACSDTGLACQSVAQCPPVAGHCTISAAPCFTDLQCPDEGHCSLTGLLCTSVAQCPVQPGACTLSHLPCFSDPQCPVFGAQCTVTHAACTIDANCPTVAGACSVDAQACTVDSNCPPTGQCNITAAVCHSTADCPIVPGTCSSSAASCTVDANCPTLAGHCSITSTACTSDATCPPAGQVCSSTGLACTTASGCPNLPGTCSLDGHVCLVGGDCPPQVAPGVCSIDHNTCTSDSMCPPLPTLSANAVCSDLVAGSATTTIPVPNGIFEAPVIGNFQYSPGGASWTFSGSSGIQHYPSAFGANPSGDGLQTAFLQNLGSMSQAISFNPGSYRISFLAARRSSQIQPVKVSLDGVPLGSPVVPSADNQFNTFAFGFTITSAGTHTISFAGTDGTTDKTSFIDAVTITSGMSLLEDANGAGLVCRHNNKAYGAVSASRYNYPDSTFNTPVAAGTGPNACVPSARYASVPRHYYKTGVEWCDKQVATAGDKWLGYGTPTGGSCQDSTDVTHTFPRFYQFGQPAGTDNYATPAFQRMDLDITKRATATYTHTWTDDSGDIQTITRTFDGATPDVSEMTNYANWFAYYRTRIQAVKTVTSLAFKELDSKYRVGFHNLFKLSSFVNIQDFTAAQKAAWYTQLFGVTIPLGQETPSLDALVRIGEYYKNGTHPQLVGSTDPIVLACQKNWHMFFTDGYTNQAGLPTITYGDQDDIVPALPEPVLGLTTGQPWPAPYREDTAGMASNSLSDYATYYWVTDLRTSGAQSTDNVPVSNRDPASWQHQNFAALALGTSGKLPAGSQSTTEDQLKAGTLQWPKPSPSVFKPDNSGVDDLWHAAINGRGRFVNAQSADELKLGIGQVLADIVNQGGSRAGVGFQSINLGASSQFIYRVRFEPDWGGSVTKIQIDPATLALISEVWNLSDQLTSQLQVTVSAPTPWFTERKIVTKDQAGASVPFLWANLGANQRDSLAPGKPPARQQMILEFLRGNRAKEGPKLGQLRARNGPLGDVVDSGAVYVGPPKAPYRDSNDPGYSAFKASMSTRLARVYVAANDGMLHAIDDLTGNEAWAYIPSPLYRGGTAGGDPKTGLGALSYQDGALPPFKHHFYVDQTPRIIDINDGVNWHTLLVGGMGKGGNRYYALDVTDPAAITSEAAAATKVRWEFPQVGDTTTDMGYSYGKPLIAKTRAFGGAWLAIVASGYNNPSGNGNLYFLNAWTGALLKTMSTGVGSAGAPSGLAHPSFYTKDFHNQLAEQIYAGDLLGNFWRFDVSDSDPNNWTMGQMAILVDPSGIAQPVTTPPQIEIDVTNGIDRWVFVGTGKLYDDSDLTSTQIQTMYALRDGTDETPLPLPSPALDRFTVGLPQVSHSAALDFGLSTKPDKGWFDDLPLGQQIVVPPQAELSIIAYIGTSAQTDPCLTGQQAHLYARDYATGKSFLTESDGVTVTESIAFAEGGVGLEFVTMQTADGSLDLRLVVTAATTGNPYPPVKPKQPSIASQHRMSWRLLGQ